MTESQIVEDPPPEYVSDFIGAAVRNAAGRTLGKVRDVVVTMRGDSRPVVNGLLVRAPALEPLFVPWVHVSRSEPGQVLVDVDDLDPRPFERRPGEILLARDLRDKEVVHVDGKRVVRANDVMLETTGAHLEVSGVDVGLAGIVTQLGLRGLARKRFRRVILPWDEVEMFASNVPVPITMPHNKIRRMHPSDLARVCEDLSFQQSSELLAEMTDEEAAEVIEDLEPEYQATLLTTMDRERAADILEEMPPEAAADVLNDIDEDDPDAADELVRSMESEEAAAVERLRVYADDTAGGLMTPDFVALPESALAEEALAELRRRGDDLPETIDPIFVTDASNPRSFIGIVSLRTLVLADQSQPLRDLMETDVATLDVQESASEAARLIAHYNLPAIPVLDERRELAGVIVMNEALDVLLSR